VLLAKLSHPFPSRTRTLRTSAAMVLHFRVRESSTVPSFLILKRIFPTMLVKRFAFFMPIQCRAFILSDTLLGTLSNNISCFYLYHYLCTSGSTGGKVLNPNTDSFPTNPISTSDDNYIYPVTTIKNTHGKGMYIIL
jgi:hypothetical protein